MKDKWSVRELSRVPTVRQGDQSLLQTSCEMWNLVTATQSVLHRLAALALPGSLSEMQDLWPHPRPTESESAFQQESQVIWMCLKA